jgi:pimeloyl-ACP methyl ester carboxylesterase
MTRIVPHRHDRRSRTRRLLPISVCLSNLLLLIAAVLVLVCVVLALPFSVVLAKSLSANEMDLILTAANLSNRIYQWDNVGFDEGFETYYESDDQVDAVVVAVYPSDKRCIVVFCGTKPMHENQVHDGGGGIIAPDITTAGIIDLLSNVAFQKEEIYSKTNTSNSCTVGQPMLQSYYNNMQVVEDLIDADCVTAGNMSLIFTGHSQGAALAQLAAVRYEQQQPLVITFGPAPAFFDDCPTLPHERIVNFVNTETDHKRFHRNVPVQFDIIPFLDVFLDKYNLVAQSSPFSSFASSSSFWSFLPETVHKAFFAERTSRLSDFFIGTYKGAFYILNPDALPSLAYAPRRADILRDSTSRGAIVDVDLLDVDEMLNFSSTTYGQRFVSAHEMNNYQRKLEQLVKQADKNQENPVAVVVAANGFESFTSCNPSAESWKQCAGFCAEHALMCTTGAHGEPCSSLVDCVKGLSCTWTLKGMLPPRLVWRCL